MVDLTDVEKKLLSKGVQTNLAPEDTKIEDATVKSPSLSLPKAPSSQEVIDAQNRLAIKKIEKEMEKLDNVAPNTSFDPVGKMLEMMQQQNNMQMNFLQKDFENKLEIANLKAVNSSENGGEMKMYLEMLAPYIPEILKALKNPSSTTVNQEKSQDSQPLASPDKPSGTPFQQGAKVAPAKKTMTEEEKMLKEINKQKKLIRDGKLTEPEAYERFKKLFPLQSKDVTSEMFTKIYNDIKEGK